MIKGRKTTQKERAKNSGVLHRAWKRLRIDNWNLWGIITADIHMGAEIWRKRGTRLDWTQRKVKSKNEFTEEDHLRQKNKILQKDQEM